MIQGLNFGLRCKGKDCFVEAFIFAFEALNQCY
jgi:hypothetical protein